MEGSMDGYVSVEMDDKLKELLETIFDDEFMQENTNFKNFEAFKYSSAVITNWNSDPMVYAQLLMDGFVKESTKFETFDEMVKAASDRKFKI
jgi:hypothetical protein